MAFLNKINLYIQGVTMKTMTKTQIFAATLLIASSVFSGISQAAIHTIDVLVLHPPKSVLNKDFPALAATMESYANKALENSGANIQFRVVGVEEINIPNPRTWGTTLGVLRKNTRAKELKAKYGADLVSMITPTGPACGTGFLLPGRNGKFYSWSKNYAYSVVADRCISAFAHELGHNLSLHHSFKQGNRGSLYSWGRGHGVDNKFVTTMAYESAYKARRLQFFSNPELKLCKGYSCGSPIEREDGAHAVKVINISGPQISNFVKAIKLPEPANRPPSAVDDLVVTRNSQSVDIKVLDNDVDPDSDTLTLDSVGAAKHGETSISGGIVHYIPESGFMGQDNFKYTISDGQGHQVNATVTVNVGWGVNYQYFEGEWDRLPDFEKLTPVAEGITYNFTLEPRLRDDKFAFRFRAKLNVPKKGNYRFYLSSDEGSELLIDGKRISINDGLHSARRAIYGYRTLAAGLHDIDLRYFEKYGNEGLKLEWRAVGILKREQIPSSALRIDGPKPVVTKPVTPKPVTPEPVTPKPVTPKPVNSNPVARDDKASTEQGTKISIDVLKNDTDADRDALKITSFGGAENGRIYKNNNQLFYLPSSGFSGTDSFTYTISDGRGGEDTGLVTVTVAADQGMTYEYYEGRWSRLPNFDSLTAVKSGHQDDFRLTNRLRNDNFAFRFRAGLDVPRNGYYYFYLNSDDGSKLFIDGKLVVNNDGLHGSRWKGRRIKLGSGVHDIEVQFFERGGRERLMLYWRGPGVRMQKLTSKHLKSPNL